MAIANIYHIYMFPFLVHSVHQDPFGEAASHECYVDACKIVKGAGHERRSAEGRGDYEDGPND